MFDVQIINPVVQNSFAVFKVSNTSMTWSKLKINFFASTRADIDIGYAEVSRPNYNSNKFTLDYPLKKSFTNSSSLKAKVFIQSLSMESVDRQFVGLYLKQTSISLSKVAFEYLSPNNQSLIKFLQVSVIVYDMNSPGMLFADG